MKYCNNCNKLLRSDKEDFEGLCANCYQDYWMKKIPEIIVDPPVDEEPRENFFKKLIHFFKRK